MPPLAAIATDGGLVVLQSPRLADAGFRHGFSTRQGGVSEAPFESLNLGLAAAEERDARDRIDENRRRFAAAIGAEGLPWVATQQVHGAAVFWAGAGPATLGIPVADAVVSATPRQLLSVRTADCLPILLACPRSGVAASVHAGWRGLVAGVIGAAIDSMEPLGADRQGLLAAIGAAIGGGAYEVGEEVEQAFAAAGGGGVFGRRGGRPHLDLFATAVAQLERAGVPAERIDGTPLCTFADEARFFSYRRDGPRSGRLAAVIEPRPGGERPRSVP